MRVSLDGSILAACRVGDGEVQRVMKPGYQDMTGGEKDDGLERAVDGACECDESYG
jgi:hypothetical protein